MLRWRLVDLAQWIREEFALSAKRHTLGRELRAMGYRKLSARPGHRGQRPGDIAYFKSFASRLPQIRRKLPRGTPVERWRQDEARVGQQTKLTRRWARRGIRPSAPKDQQRSSAWALSLKLRHDTERKANDFLLLELEKSFGTSLFGEPFGIH